MAQEQKQRRKSHRPWSLASIAQRYDLSVDELRRYCEQKKIPAKRTPGGQWRVILPLSPRTVQLLSRKKQRAAFRRMFGDAKVGQMIGDYKPEWAVEEIEKILKCELDPFPETNADAASRARAQWIYQSLYVPKNPLASDYWLIVRAVRCLKERSGELTMESIAKELDMDRRRFDERYNNTIPGKTALQCILNFFERETPDEIIALLPHTGEFYKKGGKSFIKGMTEESVSNSD